MRDVKYAALKASPKGMASIAVGNAHGRQVRTRERPCKGRRKPDGVPCRVRDRSLLTGGAATGYWLSPLRGLHAPRLQSAQESDQIFFLLRRQVELFDEIEKLDRVLKRQQAAIVQVRWRLFDAAQREGLDRPLRGDHHAAFHARAVEALNLQIMHQPVGVVRRRVTGRATGFAEEEVFAADFALARPGAVEAAKEVQLRRRR